MSIEVIWAYFMLKGRQPVGVKIHEQILDVVKKYPEHFPWESKYMSIPKEVHEAFYKECNPDWDKPVEVLNDGKGLMEHIREQGTTAYTSSSNEDLARAFSDMVQWEENRRKEVDKREKEVRRIWKKHYKKYSLPYKS